MLLRTKIKASYKKVIIYNFIIVLLIFFFIELGLILFSNITKQGLSDNLIDKNSEITKHNKQIEAVAYGKKVFTDSFGFRVPSLKFEYNKNSNNNILILGDSVSFGVGVLEEHSFIGLLRKNLVDKNLYNTSVVGHNVKDYSNLLEEYVKKLDFDNIIIFLCLNDIIQQSGVARRDFLKENKLLNEINFFLRDKFLLFVLLKSILRDPRKLDFEYFEKIYQDQKSLKFFEKKILQIKNFSEINNKKLNVVLLPFEFQVRNKCIPKYMSPQYKISDIMQSNKIFYYDFSENFCQTDNPTKLFLTFDSVHLSKTGNELVYNLIKKKIIGNN